MIINDYMQNELIDSYNQILQKQIVAKWLEWRNQGLTHYKNIQESGFRCYSQFEEDGIILYLMTMLGITNGTCVEISCGQGIECMSTNLILNHGFKGYLFDGSTKNIQYAQDFFKAKKDCMALQPVIRKAWMSRDNVNSHLLAAGCHSEIDFLSIDIDGMDYWLWKAIDVISPKVCCIETHDWIPSNLSLTVPYSEHFSMVNAEEPGFR